MKLWNEFGAGQNVPCPSLHCLGHTRTTKGEMKTLLCKIDQIDKPLFFVLFWVFFALDVPTTLLVEAGQSKASCSNPFQIHWSVFMHSSHTAITNWGWNRTQEMVLDWRHTLRKPPSNTTRKELTWNPQGPRNSWKRSMGQNSRKQVQYIWEESRVDRTQIHLKEINE